MSPVRGHDCCSVSRSSAHSLHLSYGIRNLPMNELQYNNRGIGLIVIRSSYSTEIAILIIAKFISILGCQCHDKRYYF
jgi:hypothetical protein